MSEKDRRIRYLEHQIEIYESCIESSLKEIENQSKSVRGRLSDVAFMKTQLLEEKNAS